MEAMQIIRAVLKELEPPPTARSKPTKARKGIRIHIDGAARGNPGPAGVGVVIIGADGEVAERLYRGIGETTNNVAEYRALLLALERAQALGYADIEVFSDSELLVRQLQGRYLVKHPTLKELHTLARERIEKFQRFGIQHVPREQNSDADALANQGIDEANRVGRRGTKPDLDSQRSRGEE